MTLPHPSIRRWAAATAAALLALSVSPAMADVQYVYDSAGRLIKAIYSNGITVEYRYDAAGNRTEILSSQSSNTAPNAVNDSASTTVSSSINIMVRNNDTDADGNNLTVTSVTTPTGGSVVIQGGGTYVRYTAPGSAGSYTFNYTLSDGAGGTDTATVTVTVSAANTPPVGNDDYATVAMGTSQAIMVLMNDTDANGHTLTVTNVTTPTGGSASIGSGGGYVSYTAPMSLGYYTFDYTVSDGHGGTDTATVTVEVTSGEEPCDFSGPEQCEIDP